MVSKPPMVSKNGSNLFKTDRRATVEIETQNFNDCCCTLLHLMLYRLRLRLPFAWGSDRTGMPCQYEIKQCDALGSFFLGGFGWMSVFKSARATYLNMLQIRYTLL